jgi:hypothetical protein
MWTHRSINACELMNKVSPSWRVVRRIEQSRRAFDLGWLAKRERTAHATNLAVQLAGDRVRQTVTPDDPQRRVDRSHGQGTPRSS